MFTGSAGDAVTIVGRNADRLLTAVNSTQVLEAHGGSVRCESADRTGEDEAACVVAAGTVWHGRLHGVVHCAGRLERLFGRSSRIDSAGVATYRRSRRQRGQVHA
ncbi:hypothetical protein ABFA25_00320 [Mycobacterium lepromatosis]|nr:hypothetical protein [Mycobacterium lepromatosis]